MSSGSGYDLGTGETSSDEGAFTGKKKGGVVLSGKIVFKAQLGEDIRRVQVHNDQFSFDELVNIMQSVFCPDIGKDLIIKYKDEDGDLVTIFDSADLAHAISCSRMLKLKIFPGKKEGAASLRQGDVADLRIQLRVMRDQLNSALDLLDNGILATNSISITNLSIHDSDQGPIPINGRESQPGSSTSSMHGRSTTAPPPDLFAQNMQQPTPTLHSSLRHPQQHDTGIPMGNQGHGNQQPDLHSGQHGGHSNLSGNHSHQVRHVQFSPQLDTAQGGQGGQMSQFGPQPVHGNHQSAVAGPPRPTGHTSVGQNREGQSGQMGSNGYQIPTGNAVASAPQPVQYNFATPPVQPPGSSAQPGQSLTGGHHSSQPQPSGHQPHVGPPPQVAYPSSQPVPAPPPPTHSSQRAPVRAGPDHRPGYHLTDRPAPSGPSQGSYPPGPSGQPPLGQPAHGQPAHGAPTPAGPPRSFPAIGGPAPYASAGPAHDRHAGPPGQSTYNQSGQAGPASGTNTPQPGPTQMGPQPGPDRQAGGATGTHTHSVPPVGNHGGVMTGGPMGIQIGGEEGRQGQAVPSQFNWQQSATNNGRTVQAFPFQAQDAASNFYPPGPAQPPIAGLGGPYSAFEPPRAGATATGGNPYSRTTERR